MIKRVIDEIHKLSRDINSKINLMEICGTHTVSIKRLGIESLLPDNINLISGPGCPVCVSPSSLIGQCIYLIENYENIIIYTFGDMLRVPYKGRSLLNYKDRVKLFYSPLEVLDDKTDCIKVVLGIGFETTVPLFGTLIERIINNDINNICFLTSFKAILPAMDFLLSNENNIHGFILPGHVSAITGSDVYKSLLKTTCIPGCVAGFTSEQILSSILFLLYHYQKGVTGNVYKEVVKRKGNQEAISIIDKYFIQKTCYWRGIGELVESGYYLKDEYSFLDLKKYFFLPKIEEPKSTLCRCGEIIMGKIKPYECSLFKNKCTPNSPLGPCMVSGEGTCSAYFKYGGNIERDQISCR